MQGIVPYSTLFLSLWTGMIGSLVSRWVLRSEGRLTQLGMRNRRHIYCGNAAFGETT